MLDPSMHAPKHYSQISVSGEARLHAGDQYILNQNIYQAVTQSKQVLRAFGSELWLLQVVDFAASLVRATQTLLSLSEAEPLRPLDLKELAYRYEWLEGFEYSQEDQDQDQCADHGASPRQALKCQSLAKSLLGELEDLQNREQLLVDRGIKCAEERNSTLNELRKLRDPHKSRENARSSQRLLLVELNNLWIKAAQQSLASGEQRSKLELQLNAVTESNGPLARTLLTLFWSEAAMRSGRVQALTDESESVELAKELADSVNESYGAVTDGVLRDLAFAHMEDRSRNIDEAFPKTYHWALTDERLDGPGLRKWLAGGQGIYWITGKAGSGKSTLMKFLAAQPESQKLLRHWSNGQELVISSFYFWFAGVPLQKSTEGLLRSILHQIISERRALAKVAFPDLYDEPQVASSQTSWTEGELLEAFRAIAMHRVNSRRKKFCLFIDGLDEYHGNHTGLVQRLALLVQNDDIKLCVASRPWNAFQKAYEDAVPNLRVEELSQPDMLRFVTQQIYAFRLGKGQSAIDSWDIRDCGVLEVQDITQDERDPDTDALIALIVSRAEGVFLWVYLVVRSVLEGLSEGDTLEILSRRVKTFPPDLRGFFRSIYNRVDRLYREQTSQYLKLALLYMEDETAGELACWLDFWLISKDVSGLQPDTVYDLLETPGEFNTMMKDLRRSVNSCCRDLLVTSRGSNTDITVTWLHRTVYDFIIAERLTTEVDANVPVSFKNGDALHWIWLARWRLTLGEYPWLRWNKQTEAIMSRVVNTDMSRGHALWSERYAAKYDSLLHRFGKDAGAGPRMLLAGINEHPRLYVGAAHLVAYGQTRYVNKAIETVRPSSMGDTPALKPLLLAAFGEHPARPFPLHDINIELMETISRLDGILHESSIDRGCTKTFWQLFWRKWALTSQAFTPTELAHVWTVAKLLLQSRPPAGVDVSFCVTSDEPSTLGHVHVHCDVVPFLHKTVPEDWLTEVKHLPVPAGQPILHKSVPEEGTAQVEHSPSLARQPFLHKSVTKEQRTESERSHSLERQHRSLVARDQTPVAEHRTSTPSKLVRVFNSRRLWRRSGN